MLRRRKANPDPARPEPIDPSTIPEARSQSYAEADTSAPAPVPDPEAPAAPESVEASATSAPAPPELMNEAFAEPAAEVPETPATPDVPEVPAEPEIPQVPQQPEVPEVPEAPEIPVAPDPPEVPDVPNTPDIPETPNIPETHDVAADESPVIGDAADLPGLDSQSALPEEIHGSIAESPAVHASESPAPDAVDAPASTETPSTPEPPNPDLPSELPSTMPPPLPDPVGRPVDPISPLARFAPPPPPEPFKPPVRSTLPSKAPLASKRAGTLIGGIDLGGTKIAAAIIGPNNEVISYRRRPTPDRGGPADVVRAMATTIQEAAQDAGVEAHHLLGVGVGSPGAVDNETGAVSGAGNLPGWDGRFQLGMALREAIGTPVEVGNDVGVATDAEFQLGVGQEYDSLLGVFWGTGVGGGIILNGKPWHGRGKAGEIGHMVVKDGGAKCGCGNRGCMEAYAGRKSMETKAIKEYNKGVQTDLFKLAEKHGKPHLTSAIWAKALEHEDELATKLLDRAVKALSAGIASAVNLLDPEAVVIGGGLGIRFGNTLVPKIIEGMGEHLFDSDNPPPVKVAALGDEGGVIGASLLVRKPA